MKTTVTIILSFILFPLFVWAQNCCAPAIPQQGVLGEIAALPHTLEIGFHYELLHSDKMYDGSKIISDPANTKAQWQQATTTAAYGIFRRLTVSAIIPYIWKKKAKDYSEMGMRVENSTNGIGDITFLVRFSPLARSFVSYRELSLGLGIKLPTGSVRERNFGFLLPEELQPGTGSWDFDGSFSYFQGFELVDFIVSGTYLMTSAHNNYEFGDQFSYILASNFHIKDYLDFSASVMGLSRAKDRLLGSSLQSTGRDQVWLTPGLKYQILPNKLGLQAYYEYPVYQYFNGAQLGGGYNIRLSAVYTFQLSQAEKEDE